MSTSVSIETFFYAVRNNLVSKTLIDNTHTRAYIQYFRDTFFIIHTTTSIRFDYQSFAYNAQRIQFPFDLRALDVLRCNAMRYEAELRGNCNVRSPTLLVDSLSQTSPCGRFNLRVADVVTMQGKELVGGRKGWRPPLLFLLPTAPSKPRELGSVESKSVLDSKRRISIKALQSRRCS